MSMTFGAVANRTPEKRSHRTGQPVRRNSRLRGHCEAGFWRPLTKKDGWRLVVLAKEYDKLRKEKGKKNGALGGIAIEILEYMIDRMDRKTGRLEPSLDTLMKKLGRSRDAIWKALKRLQAHGFIDWLRRYEPTGNDGAGPQVQQTSNAYRLLRPRQAEQAVAGASTPLPDDIEQAELEKDITRAEHEVDEIGGRAIVESLAEAQSTTGQWARRLLVLLDRRESAKRTEPCTEYIL